MKKLTYVQAQTENYGNILKFKIPLYSEIRKIEYRAYYCSESEYYALVFEDIPQNSSEDLKSLTKIETYHSVQLNQELDHSFDSNLIIVSRKDENHNEIDDTYFVRKWEK